jgi:hypothetical protein
VIFPPLVFPGCALKLFLTLILGLVICTMAKFTPIFLLTLNILTDVYGNFLSKLRKSFITLAHGNALKSLKGAMTITIMALTVTAFNCQHYGQNWNAQ